MMTPIHRLAAIGALALAGACSDDSATAQSQTEAPVADRTELVQDRFRVVESALDHGGTLSALLQALDRRDLTVFAIIDHAAAAQSVDMTLSPTTLVIFGSPRAGTPLIQAVPLMGAELPLRALIYDRDGTTHLALTGIRYLERNYNLREEKPVVEQILDTLDTIANEATTP
jgi:uncharacterized protein (DUF302 family)